jgi:isochorismate pyruvate lyase
MKNAKDCTNMTEIRAAIDNIDTQIVKLIAERSKYVHEAAKFKTDEKSVKDSKRVQQVIESKIKLAVEHGAPSALVEELYKMMINFFIDEEMKEWKSK